MKDERILNLLQSLLKEIDSRVKFFVSSYDTYIQITDVDDRAECLSEMIDILEGINLRMGIYGNFIKQLQDESISPLINIHKKEQYIKCIEQYQNKKLIIAELESKIVGLLN